MTKRAPWMFGARRRVRRPAALAAAAAVAAALVVGVPGEPAGADVATFTNTTPIAIPATGSANQIGPASPYPSSVTATGMAGTVSDVNVTLTSLSHGVAQDLDILLVGPAGQNIVLLSDPASGGGFSVNGSLTFDDSAAGTVPATGVVGTGTFQPTNLQGAGDPFPAPAPTPSTATALTVFNGTNPNGTWSLFVVDDATGDLGSMAGGWSITITTAEVPQPGILAFTTASYRGVEGDGTVTLTVQRTGGDDGAVSARVTTGGGSATAGTDFAPLDQVVSFADGQTSATVALTILDDALVEGVDETVDVTLSEPTGGAVLGPPTAAVVIVDDNDAIEDRTGITIPAMGSGTTTGAPASPYPSTIHVTGRPSPIGGVEVTLHGFGHQVPIDVDVLLVGPNGQNVVLMSDTGGLAQATSATLTFADAATGRIPAAGPLVTGRYDASDEDPLGAADPFPAPAPAPSAATDLSAFVGIVPNGAWSLYVVDDASGDVGSIAGGWSLTFLPLVLPDAGGPYTVGEGADLALDGTGTSAGPTATFAWDLDGDSQFDDATGASPVVTAATLAALGLGDGPAGPATIGLQVTEGPSVAVDTTDVTITNVAPTAAVGTLPAVTAGDPAAFPFTAADPAAADTAAGFTYAITWGDGTPVQTVAGSAAVSVAHTYAATGTFTLSVTATDKDGGTSTAATAVVTVAAPPPVVVADAGGPYTVDEGDALALDASGTAAGATATYAWDLDADGQFDDATGPAPVVTAATLAGLGLGDGPVTGTVTVQVTEGPTVDTDTATLDVDNAAPTASIDAVPPLLLAGVSGAFDLSATDPAAADLAAGFTYEIDWGDGGPVETVTGGASVSAAHAYATAGSVTISVVAVDKDGASSAPAVQPVTVLAGADAGGPYTIDEGDALVLDASGTAAGPAVGFAWDLDGDTQFDDAVGATPTIPPATLEALGLADGPIAASTIAVQVTAGGLVDVDTTTVTVVNVAPTAAVGAVPPVVVAGVAEQYGLSASDPAAADLAAGFTYTVDWGDGSAAETVTGPASASAPHTYAAPGSFTISVTATDKDGATGPAGTATVTVDPAVVADAGGPYVIDEGDDLALDASGSVAGSAATYAWDLDGDGAFDDATGAEPTLTAAELAPLGLADGPAGPLTISVQVTEGPTVAAADATVTIANVAPVATVDLPPQIVAGTPTTVKVGAVDPSPVDAAGQFEYRVDWEGDGTIDDVVFGPADPPVTHTYPSAAEVGFTVIAVDKDGAASAPTVTIVTVSPADAGGPGGGGAGGAGGPGAGGGPGSPGGAGGGGAAGRLPRTGSAAEAQGVLAAALVLTGAWLVEAGRRRRTRLDG